MPRTADRVLGEAFKLAPDERLGSWRLSWLHLTLTWPSENRSEPDWIWEIERRVQGAWTDRGRDASGWREIGEVEALAIGRRRASSAGQSGRVYQLRAHATA